METMVGVGARWLDGIAMTPWEYANDMPSIREQRCREKLGLGRLATLQDHSVMGRSRASATPVEVATTGKHRIAVIPRTADSSFAAAPDAAAVEAWASSPWLAKASASDRRSAGL